MQEAGRHTLADHAFGDAEVDWMKDDQQVASGYFGRSGSVSIMETAERDATSFSDEAAAELRHCGKSVGYARNDSQE